MSNPHFDISIVKRSKGMSAVAGAAYQSGERLFSEYDQKYKDYKRKEGVIYTEIMLPVNAPSEFYDRATLWNSVEEVEKQWNSQLALRFVFAFPREIPSEYYPQMVNEYCEEHFVSKGMCCDFAIHDSYPLGHNPHCHIMLTMRGLDEHGKWLPKSRKVYDLDENGERIKLPKNLANLLCDYMNLRKAERSEWSKYGQHKGTTEDLKAVSQATIYLTAHNIFTLEDLDIALQGVNEKAREINIEMKKAEKRMKVIVGIQKAVADCQTHKAVHDKYLKIGWKTRQARGI